jgi:son of sevenless-like protein
MNNFNLLMALVSGMNNACVARLKWTKALMSRKSLETLERLETLMSPEGSYKAYRETLASINPPCIPFIAVHLSDLVYANHPCRVSCAVCALCVVCGVSCVSCVRVR